MANSASAPSSGASGPASGMSAVPQALLHASPRATSTSPKLHTRTCDDVFVVKWRWPSPVTSLLRPPSSTVYPLEPHVGSGLSKESSPTHTMARRGKPASRSSFLRIGIFRRSRGGEGRGRIEWTSDRDLPFLISVSSEDRGAERETGASTTSDGAACRRALVYHPSCFLSLSTTFACTSAARARDPTKHLRHVSVSSSDPHDHVGPTWVRPTHPSERRRVGVTSWQRRWRRHVGSVRSTWRDGKSETRVRKRRGWT